MNIATLITDWNENDFFTGAVKLKFSEALGSDFNLIEITHRILPYSYIQSAYVLKNSLQYFPKNTCHIIAVNDSYGLKNGFLAIEHNGQYIFCADNGIPSLALDNYAEKVIKINAFEVESPSFPALSVLINSAIFALKNRTIDSLGESVDSFKDVRIPVLPTLEKSKITGQIHFIDSYKNAVTNIDKRTFERIGKGRKFEITAGTVGYKICKISKSYCEVRAGDLLALFNNSGMLELAQNEGNFVEILGLNNNSSVIINFIDE
jgi:S-adenosylmethionine hydrolase